MSTSRGKVHDITLADKDAKKKELIKFLESKVDVEISKDEQDKEKSEQIIFRRKITKLIDSVFGRQYKNPTPDGYAMALINKTLIKYNLDYKVDSFLSKSEKKYYWTVYKHNWEQEKTDNVDQEDGEAE